MLEWLATAIVNTQNGLALESSDSWSLPYAEPIKGDRIALRQGELASAVAGLQADVRLVPWMPNLARVVATVTLRNPGSTWLRWLRIDVEALDQAHVAKPIYTSFLVSAVKPRETATQTNDRLWLHLTPRDFPQVRFKTTARLVGGFRLQPAGPAK